MAQIFNPSANTIAKFSILAALVGVSALLVLGDALQKASYTTRAGAARPQPVPFSHKHHAALGLDCRYCHTTVEESASANIPPTKICMNCHSMIWSDAPVLEPVRNSWATGESLEWTRVHDLPQYVYFNHSIHVNKGIGCSTCHGRVDKMPLVRQVHSLYMGWCLDCHRQPENHLRPQEAIFDMEWTPPPTQAVDGPKLLDEYNIDTSNFRMLDCYNCHR